jgi:hypothetical protein
MGKWLDLAARLEAEGAGDNRDNRDVSPSIRPNVPNVPNVPQSLSLPLAVARGLATLPGMACPHDLNSARWPVAVADAVKLGGDGWAAKAIALGWSDLDLFGVVAAFDGDPDADGLAVKLGGRGLLAICGTFATVDPGSGGRLYLHRGNNDGARLLWTPGHGR